MWRSPVPSLFLFASLLASPGLAQSAPPLTLIGEDGAQKTLTMAQLAALPQTELRVRESDSTTLLFRGPTLRALVTLVGAPTGQALRGPLAAESRGSATCQ
jgi:hypothetical protein